MTTGVDFAFIVTYSPLITGDSGIQKIQIGNASGDIYWPKSSQSYLKNYYRPEIVNCIL